ncbi:MAG: glycosyltransferase family 4 protein [Tatlockia sp.]|nr:glycosyltransferase family 4 protein [Tatlockia sp.]
MNILFINTGPWGTGSFTLIKCLTIELLKLGHRVKIFFPDGNFESLDKEEYYKNPELYCIWQFPLKNHTAILENFPLIISDPHPRNPQAITFRDLTETQISLYESELEKELSKLIREFKPDVIECHHIWYSSWVLRQMGQRYLLTAHHSDQIGFHYDEKVRKKAIAGAQNALKIIAISDSVKNEVFELYGVAEAKIELIANGYDKDIFKVKKVNKQDVLDELGITLEPGAQLISFVGKLSSTKGIDILLKANRLLDPELKVHFLILGAGDIENICSKMDPATYSLNNLHFLGQQTPENVAKINNISKFSVMPSRSEGFGISCLEAMACGLPVIVTRCGGPETFAVGKIVDKESPFQLAEGILEMLNLSDLKYKNLREEALKVAEKFSITAITQQHLDLYNQVGFRCEN